MCSGLWMCIHEMVTARSLHQVCFTRIKALLRVSPIPREVWDKGCCRPPSCHTRVCCVSLPSGLPRTRGTTGAHGSGTRHAPRVARPGPHFCSSVSASPCPAAPYSWGAGGRGLGVPRRAATTTSTDVSSLVEMRTVPVGGQGSCGTWQASGDRGRREPGGRGAGKGDPTRLPPASVCAGPGRDFLPAFRLLRMGELPDWCLVSFRPYPQLAVGARLNGQKVIFPHGKPGRNFPLCPRRLEPEKPNEKPTELCLQTRHDGTSGILRIVPRGPNGFPLFKYAQ